MAGFVLLLARDGGPVAAERLAAPMRRLAHRGTDGQRTVSVPGAALGHLHFWTTPEEVGERQPLSAGGGGPHLLFDGRLDNRDQLATELGRRPAGVSDAALVLAAYERWGEAFLQRLLGPFALALVDVRRRRVLLGRDALGDRSLFYRLDDRLLAVASEEQALLALPGVRGDLDQETLARFFAVMAPAPGRTFFNAVSELPAGYGMVVGENGERRWQHWRPEPGRWRHLGRDRDCAEALADLLTEAVRCRLRSPAPPAVLMSGGLDSTPVAALAARERRRQGAAEPLTAVSWVFDELPQCDEREFMRPVVDAWGLDHVQIVGDDAWPLGGGEPWAPNPNSPLEGVYRRLQLRAFAAVTERGGRTVLSGDCGDQLYAGGAYWLRDLLHQGRLLRAARELGRELRPRHGRSWAARTRGPVARALGWRRRRPLHDAPWLTPRGRALLGDAGPPAAAGWRRPEQAAAVLDPRLARAVSLETGNASRAGVDIRRPYRDRRLVEFFLAVPAHLLYRPGWSKWLLRQATRGLLPEAVRRRRRPSTLLPLCRRGLVEREAERAAALLAAPVLWHNFVRRDWLDQVYPDRLVTYRDGLESVIPWRCICSTLWQQQIGGFQCAA